MTRGRFAGVNQSVLKTERTSESTPLARRSCQHCGTPFAPRRADEQYCCTGCEQVHALIESQGFEDYYALKKGVTEPLLDKPIAPQNWSWIGECIEKTTDGDKLVFAVDGVSCPGCVWLAEQIAQRHPEAGLRRIKLDQHRATFSLPAEAEALVALAEDWRLFGILLRPVNEAPPAPIWPWGRLAICGALALNALMFSLPMQMVSDNTFAFHRLFAMLSALSGGIATLVAIEYVASRKSGRTAGLIWSLSNWALAGGLAACIMGWLWGRSDHLPFEYVAIAAFLQLAAFSVIKCAGRDRPRD
ncbi:MAG: heavy metal translocating P-type ATPase metal-binding domain-containing protein [Puniceicoccales bacterium]